MDRRAISEDDQGIPTVDIIIRLDWQNKKFRK